MKEKLLLPTAMAVAAISLAGILPAIAGTGTSSLLGSNNSATTTSSMVSNSTGSSSMNHTTTTTASTAQLVMDNGTLDCKAIAHELGGIPVPNGKVCDVVVVRQSPQITGMNGLNMNQFTLMNSVIEFLSVPANTTTASTSNETGLMSNSTMMTTTGSSSNKTSDHNTYSGQALIGKSASATNLAGNNNSTNNATTGNTTTSSTGSHQVYVMGDFALLETEMNGVLSVVKDNGWTVTGIHNHMINEKPKTTFMHWEVTGDINQIVDQVNQAFAKTSIKG